MRDVWGREDTCWTRGIGHHPATQNTQQEKYKGTGGRNGVAKSMGTTAEGED